MVKTPLFFLCTCEWRGVHTCVCVCTTHIFGGQRTTLVIFLSLHLIFLRQVSDLTWSSLICLDCLSRELQRCSCLYFPNAGVTGVCHHTPLFMCMMEI